MEGGSVGGQEFRDHSRGVVEGGYVESWTVGDDAVGQMSGGDVWQVSLKGRGDFSQTGGKVSWFVAEEHAAVELANGRVATLLLRGESTASLAGTLVTDNVQSSDRASLRVLPNATVNSAKLMGQSMIDVSGGRFTQLELMDDAQGQASGGLLSQVRVAGHSRLSLSGPVETASMTVTERGRLEASHTAFPAVTVNTGGTVSLVDTQIRTRFESSDDSTNELRRAEFLSDGRTSRIDMRGKSQLLMHDSSYRDSMEISLTEDARFDGELRFDPQAGGNGLINVAVTQRAHGEIRSQGIPSAKLQTRDEGDLLFSGPVTKLDARGWGGTLRLAAATDQAKIDLREGGDLHIQGGPFKGSVTSPEDSVLTLHIRSTTQLPGGHLGAVLLDGTSADVAIDHRFHGQIAVVGAEGPSFSVDRDLRFNPATGNYYKIVYANGTDWPTAKAMAESMSFHGQGHLVTIGTAQEEQFLVDQFAVSSPFGGSGLWIGASDADEEGVWKWVVGPEAGQVFYRGGCNWQGCTDDVVQAADWYRPTNGGDLQPGGGTFENYVLWRDDRSPIAGASGRWHDYPVDALGAGFIVEFESLAGDASGDGGVGLEDLGILKANFGAVGDFSRGDFDYNWRINLSDFGALKQNFGRASVAAPEPPGWVLAFPSILVVIGLLVNHRRSWVVS
ncbi:MAG: hypothetical protein U0836_25795 [Pirellulales bacterium]